MEKLLWVTHCRVILESGSILQGIGPAREGVMKFRIGPLPDSGENIGAIQIPQSVECIDGYCF
jgi:hypothetical protein